MFNFSFFLCVLLVVREDTGPLFSSSSDADEGSTTTVICFDCTNGCIGWTGSLNEVVCKGSLNEVVYKGSDVCALLETVISLRSDSFRICLLDVGNSRLKFPTASFFIWTNFSFRHTPNMIAVTIARKAASAVPITEKQNKVT